MLRLVAQVLSGVRLYLDLLKRVLTDTVFAPEPDLNASDAAFLLQFTSHYVKGRAISMLPLARLDNIEACVLDVVERGVPGDLIETGVWRGGATIFMRGILKALDVRDRSVWVADSFEGLPEPDAERFPREAQAHQGVVMTKVFDRFAAGEEAVRKNFETFGLLDEQVRFLKGWFKDTLPSAPIERLAVIRLDGDYYESTMDGLTSLYPKLSPGGYVIVDDYGEDDWTYCRRAVDEFRAANGIAEPMVMVDKRCWYWRRGG
ncbi:MAG TPA: TylF/MycF/NovP-related O-methyltransferase [Candidatus Baltobacteraceae bacterium]|nr:TylF/MycF/NovP-related O-methyltransferase [Candidatus Baltobacteraceae bacterium]